MIIIVDERILVQEAYTSQFRRHGSPCLGFCAARFGEWLASADATEIGALRACLIYDADFEVLTDATRKRLAKAGVPVMVLSDRTTLDNTLRWFEAGAADVVRKPVHYRELLARIAVHRRASPERAPVRRSSRLEVFDDGRDPLVDGRPLPLPRRERCVLEHLASIGERRATKAQLHGAVYGLYDDSVEETVIESHVSKLRKKLKRALGYDPIESRRYLGYRLIDEAREPA